MKIRRQIFMAVLLISLAALLLSLVASFFMISRIRADISGVHSTQSEVLVDTNVEVLTQFNHDIVASLALV